MAAITTKNSTIVATKLLRTASAQATTGQTDWFSVPPWAQYMTVYINLTAVAGTTPILIPSIVFADPFASDDSYAQNFAAHAALTAGVTAASLQTIECGPGVTGIADDVTLGTTANGRAVLNGVLQPLMGVTILNDRTTGNETYSYTVGLHFRGGAS